MTEELLGKYLDRADEMLDGSNTLTERALILQIKLQARQARQLTIANEIANMRGVNELRTQQGLAVAYPEKSFDSVFEKPIPPDALVEAVKGTLKGMDYILQNPVHLESNIAHWQRRLEKGLAAHEKAGDSNAT